MKLFMKREDIQAWFESLLARAGALPGNRGHDGRTLLLEGPAQEWATEAQTALYSVLPESHPVREQWARVLKDPRARFIAEVMEKLLGIFAAADTLIRENRISSLIDGIWIEAESNLLDQATVLVEADYRAAAAVIAGGALETHLRHYVGNHCVATNGEGSISKYNGAVGQARKANPGLYSTNDGKLVEGWGGLRNEAAHAPGAFAQTKEEIKRMIDGIREFIAQTG